MAFTNFSTRDLVSLPPEFFTQVAPAITLPTELKVTLHLFYRLSQQTARPRRLSWDELATDPLLRQSLQAVSKLRPFEELLSEGLEAAVRRTTFLHLALPGNGRIINWYLAHTVANQAWLATQQKNPVALAPNPTRPVEKPSFLTLYEQNIGLLTPLLVEELREAEAHYPPEWLNEAVLEASRANARSWRYIRTILERWATNGRKYAPHRANGLSAVEEYTHGKYRNLFSGGRDKPT